MHGDALPPLDSAAIPRATYRLQFNAGFMLADATALVPYLHALGISHVYASPLLRARAGSGHGYDGTDPSRLNAEIGDDAAFDRFTRRLAEFGMGLMLDIVPNHMGVLEADNPWWLDVLENGPASRHAKAFDIEWRPPQHELHGKVLLPVLGASYGQVLEAGEIVPAFDALRAGFVLRYFAHTFPIDPADWGTLLQALPLPPHVPHAQRVAIGALAARLTQLPPRDAADAARRQQALDTLRDRLSALHAEPWAAAWLEACAQTLAGTPGRPESFDALDRLLQRQAYRLAHWRAANDQINYRRFFDINGLAALRMADAEVFEAAHHRVLAWVAHGKVDALRIDHPDGLDDPEAYFARLQRRSAEARAAVGGAPRATYVVVEKIFAEDEPWPAAWPAQGDTGYRFANEANGVLVDTRHAATFDALTAEFTGAPDDFDAELDAAKRSIMTVSLAADLRLLTEQARELALQHRHTRDLTRNGLQLALIEFCAAFDAYRSYVSARGVPEADRNRIERAFALARTRCLPSQQPCLDFLRTLLLAPQGDAQLRFVQRLQQFTAPVMAKAMEDTVFYRQHRLVSLNDVGGDPRGFGLSVEAFHAANAGRAADTPHTLLAGSTHDSKRSEDVRARLNVLSEIPQLWRETLQRWRELALTQWRFGGVDEPPAAGDQLLLFQTLLGFWPEGEIDDATLGELRARVDAYMLKAVREAKQQSSWLDHDSSYEQGLQRCINVLLARVEPNPFLADLRRTVALIVPFARHNSLALVAMKLTSPGVPDIYQGSEDECLALVDPDNRRPVDFAQRAMALELVRAGHVPPPQRKLWVTTRLLQWRREKALLFERGDYLPLEVTGARAEHVLAWARRRDGDCSITIVARLLWRASAGDATALESGEIWQDTAVRLPESHASVPLWADVIRGLPIRPRDGFVEVRDALAALPVAVLGPR